jgi:3-hydroxymyristoyl/3-hydroxydecanoyl-(acyl carrier protein) dehydratase
MHIDARHPALPGHFPGHPVVPGVVLLDAVLAALPAHAGQAVRVTGFPSVKFLAPLAPGQEFEVRFSSKRPDQAGFEVLAGDIRLCSGTVSYGTA